MGDGVIKESLGSYAIIFIKIALWFSQRFFSLSSMDIQDKYFSQIGCPYSSMPFGQVGLVWRIMP